MPGLLAREPDTTLVIIIGSVSLSFQPWHILCDIYRAAKLFDFSILPPVNLLAITSSMRIFDHYEHPSFEVEKADKAATVGTTIRQLGVGATVSAAIAAIGFWGYYWSDPTPLSTVFTDALHSIAHQIR